MDSARRITINPVTRLEGHGKIEIFLDEQGRVDRAYFQVPELRGFEKFAQGRPAEDMPQITSRICGVCPTAHHVASTKALDALYQVTPPPAARKIRELVYSTFVVEDHALHFYFLGGPDFVVGPQAPAAERNVLGVIAKVGIETGQKVIAMRRKLRELMVLAAGKAAHPVFGLPGGVAKPLTAEDAARFREVADEAVAFACFTLELFEKLVLRNSGFVDLIRSDAFTDRTYYMGLVDEKNQLNFYDGSLRVLSPGGHEWARFQPDKYLDHIAEHTEPWSYMNFCYLKGLGWKGFTEGEESGVYCVAPLARLNVADGLATPLAHQAYLQFHGVLGGRPVHHTLANHWARVVEMLYAAERMKELAHDPELTSPKVRTLPTAVPSEGVGVVEAPRGTLFHHYRSDERGVITAANLIVATQNNAARIAIGVEKAAKKLIAGGNVPEGLLNMVEMAFRAYDPCLGCATHSLPGSMPSWSRCATRAVFRLPCWGATPMAASTENENVGIRVLGLGNEILADDAFAILAARDVERAYTGQVEVRCSSSAGFGLLDDLLGAARLLVVDTIMTGSAKPGTVHVFTSGQVDAAPGGSPHFLGLFEVLEVARRLHLPVPEQTTIIAVEASDSTTVSGPMHPMSCRRFPR